MRPLCAGMWPLCSMACTLLLIAHRDVHGQAPAIRGRACHAGRCRRGVWLLSVVAGAGSPVPADPGDPAGHGDRAARQAAAARTVHARQRRAGGVHADHRGHRSTRYLFIPSVVSQAASFSATLPDRLAAAAPVRRVPAPRGGREPRRRPRRQRDSGRSGAGAAPARSRSSRPARRPRTRCSASSPSSCWRTTGSSSAPRSSASSCAPCPSATRAT